MTTPAQPADPIAFVRDCLDQREREAPNVHALDCELTMTAGFHGPCTCGQPEQIRREVDAKRRILDLHEGDHECSTIRRGVDCVGEAYEEIDNCTYVIGGDCSTVKLLALPHAHRPGYREEWKP